MAFKRSTKKHRLKVLLFGQPGTGKTTAALQFPNPAVFDLEEGTNFYSDKYNFIVDDTKDPFELINSVERIAQNPKITLDDGTIFDTRTLVIDPLHRFDDGLAQRYVAIKRKQERDPNYQLQLNDSKVLKFEKRRLMDRLLSVDMNVVVCASTKPIYAPGEVMKTIGIGPNIDDAWNGYFDIILYLYFDKTTNKRMAIAYGKDRSERLPKNDKGIYQPFEWSYQKFAEFYKDMNYGKESDVELSQKGREELAGRHFETIFQGKPVKTAGVIGASLEKIASFYADPIKKDKFIGLMLNAEIGEPYDLTEDQAQNLITKMEE